MCVTKKTWCSRNNLNSEEQAFLSFPSATYLNAELFVSSWKYKTVKIKLRFCHSFFLVVFFLSGKRTNFIAKLWKVLEEWKRSTPCSVEASQARGRFCFTGLSDHLLSHCWGEQTASHYVKLYFLATCLGLQLPDMANEFYNQKLKRISCSRCFFCENYQTFMTIHLSFKRIKLCTSIMWCHWSIAQLYQTFFKKILETELIFCKGFSFFNMSL